MRSLRQRRNSYSCNLGQGRRRSRRRRVPGPVEVQVELAGFPNWQSHILPIDHACRGLRDVIVDDSLARSLYPPYVLCCDVDRDDLHFHCSIVSDKHVKDGLVHWVHCRIISLSEPLLRSLLLLLVMDLGAGEECSKTASSPVNESGSGSEHYCDH